MSKEYLQEFQMYNKIINSVVVPVFNEEGNINELYRRLTIVMEQLEKPYEIIFINDGGSDKSFEMLKYLHQKDKRVKIVKFSRNFGHHIAITAGLDYAEGEAVILMDGDLQDPPEEIPKLYEKFKEGYDIIYAIRKRSEEPLLKKFTSKLFYKLFKIISNIEIPPNTGIFRILSRRVVEAIRSCRQKSRFVLSLIAWVGFLSIGVETKRKGRYAGSAKYNVFKSAKLAIDATVSSSRFPLQISAHAGFIIAITNFIMGLFIVLKKIFFGMSSPGYASIIVSVFFLGGVQLVFIGIVGEYIGRIYTEIQNKPLYIIDEKMGFDEDR